MPDITLTTLQSLKLKGEKITMLTCYDATFAHASCEAGVAFVFLTPFEAQDLSSLSPSCGCRRRRLGWCLAR